MTMSTLSRDTERIRAMVSPSFCTSLGVKMLEHFGRLLLAEGHQHDGGVIEALLIHR